MEKRDELLLRMYDQLWNNINRQISIVWQSLSALVGSITLLVLGSNDFLSIDVAITLTLFLSTWLIAHVYDSSLWCNRNLAMIGNIERSFLSKSDLIDIHYFFEKPKSKGMIEHLFLQLLLGISLSVVVIIYHIYLRVIPGLWMPIENFDFIRSLPYLSLIVLTVFILIWRNACINKYNEFLNKSPGAKISG